jgi:hypothetical protein
MDDHESLSHKNWECNRPELIHHAKPQRPSFEEPTSEPHGSPAVPPSTAPRAREINACFI